MVLDIVSRTKAPRVSIIFEKSVHLVGYLITADAARYLHSYNCAQICIMSLVRMLCRQKTSECCRPGSSLAARADLILNSNSITFQPDLMDLTSHLFYNTYASSCLLVCQALLW